MALARLRRQLSVAIRWASWVSMAPSGARSFMIVVGEAIFIGHRGDLAGEAVAEGVHARAISAGFGTRTC